MLSYADVIEMERANVRNYAFVLRDFEMKRVLIIRSPRASPAFKCECETSSTLRVIFALVQIYRRYKLVQWLVVR